MTTKRERTLAAYWAEFEHHLGKCGSPLRVGHKLGSPANRKVEHPTGFTRPGAHLAATALHREDAIRATVVLADDDSLALFEQLRAVSDTIEVDNELEWKGEHNPRVRLIHVTLGASYRDRNDWPRQFEWLRTRLEHLYQVFYPLVR